MAKDVFEQIEDCEDQYERDKAGQHQKKDLEELDYHVLVENAREDIAGLGSPGTRLKPAQQAAQGGIDGFIRNGDQRLKEA